MKIISLAILSAALLAPSLSTAADGISLGVSTLGAKANYIHHSSEYFTSTYGINYMTRNTDRSIDGNDYNGQINFKSVSLMGNYHLFANNFRLTAGVIINDNEIEVKANGDLSIGNNNYTNTTLRAKATFNRINPYLGIGYGYQHTSGFGLDFDLGAAYQGAANIDLASSGGVVTQADLDKEKQDIESELNNYKLYPVISLGVHYMF